MLIRKVKENISYYENLMECNKSNKECIAFCLLHIEIQKENLKSLKY